MKKIVKLEGFERKKGHLYFVKQFDDGVYVCETKMARFKG